MAGCKRCALKGGKREGEKEEKRKGKGRKKWGSKLFCFFLFFISLCACFYICAVVIFQIYKEISRSYPPLFVIKLLMVSQSGDF